MSRGAQRRGTRDLRDADGRRVSPACRMVSIWAVVLGTLLVAVSAQAQPASEGFFKTVDETVDVFFAPNADSVVWSRVISKDGAAFLRVFFDSITDLTEVPYKIVFIGRSGQSLLEVEAEDFARGGSYRTGILATDKVEIQLRAQAPPKGLTFRIAGFVYEEEGPKLLSIYKPDRREQIYQIMGSQKLREATKSVAKLTYQVGTSAKSCTGFLIDSRHLLTNRHCVRDQETCDTADAIFGYEQRVEGSESPGVSYPCKSVVGVSEPLDAAILALEGTPGLDGFGWLATAANAVQKKQRLVTIQHPSGEPKQVSRDGCRVITPVASGVSGDSDFGHRCDTLSGSSGSPLLDANTLQVVGLHHWGFDDWGRWVKESRAVRMQELANFVARAIEEGSE